MATADLTVLALGRSEVGASEYIAEILAVVGELHAVPFDMGIQRVYTVLKLDERRESPTRRSTTRSAAWRNGCSGG